MAAYNEIDGIYCHANKELLQDILRDELGFDGVIMADGVAIDRLNTLTGDFASSAALALNAGVQISLWDESFSHLEEAVERGLVSEEQIDKAVLAVLELKFSRGLFEHPYLDETAPTVFDYRKQTESLQLAKESAVLLKNNGLLPMEDLQNKKIAVIGPQADGLYHQLGDYTPPMREGVTLLSALKEKLPNAQISYAQGCSICGEDESGIAEAVQLAKESDVVILAVGGSSSRFAGATFDSNGAAISDGGLQMDCGEGVDCTELSLPGVQEKLIHEILALHKPVAAVVIAGRPYAIADLLHGADALLYSFYPGPVGGLALCDLLTGDCSPAGRLPCSLPRDAGHLPCYYNYKASYTPAEDPWLVPFGFGLSYTTFACEHAALPETASIAALENGEAVTVHFTVTNTGSRAAHAVPQLYLQELPSPALAKSGALPRVKELKAFTKVYLLPGESHECTLTLDKNALLRLDENSRFALSQRKFKLRLEESGSLWAQGELCLHE